MMGGGYCVLAKGHKSKHMGHWEARATSAEQDRDRAVEALRERDRLIRWAVGWIKLVKDAPGEDAGEDRKCWEEAQSILQEREPDA